MVSKDPLLSCGNRPGDFQAYTLCNARTGHTLAFPLKWPCSKSGSKSNCYSIKTSCWHLTVPAATLSDPWIFPLMQSMLQPYHYLYFPGRELESIQTQNYNFYPEPIILLSNHLVSSSISGRSTVTIQDIPEEKPGE
ncbi:hypothetical protein I3842_08G172300 [Carya illinoinensis]|uniref:Uncharacterized protein n=1 Tax=Carya illinoinensis TaxID=32201 RepID=A0A922JD55_CARIL|nr:hypothetical protein I3842_08G172300 [Carya illinoinensis]